jgi:hypothetical protein
MMAAGIAARESLDEIQSKLPDPLRRATAQIADSIDPEFEIRGDNDGDVCAISDPLDFTD